MDWPQLIFAVAVLAFGGMMIAYNATIFVTTVVSKGDASSIAPIFGSVIAAAGVALLPIAGIWKWAWIPLLIDWGGLPMYLYYWLERRRARRRRQRAHGRSQDE